MKKLLYPLLGLLVITTGCENNYVDESSCLVPDSVSFINDIQPILVSRCGTNDNGCHDLDNGIVLNANIDQNGDTIDLEFNGNGGLTSYEDVHNILFNCPDNEFMKRIQYDDSVPVTNRMPKGSSKLDDCTINRIQRWFDQGTLNN